MQWPLIENQVRLQYQLLNHVGNYTRVRCQDVNNGRRVDERRVKNANELISWAKEYHLKGNLFIGRNPVDDKGKVCRITSWSLDIDPVRPSKSASSEGQLFAALRVGEQIRRTYRDGYLCSSGNGGLLIFSLAGSTIQDLQCFSQQCRILETEIRKQFQTDEVKIDATYDIARLVKLMGSVSTKGDANKWRYARFLHRPIFRAKQPGIRAAIERIVLHESVSVSGLESSANLPTGNGISNTSLDFQVESQKLGPAARLEFATQSLRRLDPKRADNYDDWLKCGIVLKEFGQAGLQLWRDWSKQSPKYREGDCEAKFNSFRADQGLTVGTLKYWADQDDPTGARSESGKSQLRSRTLLPGLSILGGGEPPKLWQPGDGINKTGMGAGTEGRICTGTGFNWLDSKLNGGYRPGVVYAIEACTNVGKSQFIIQTAEWCCKTGFKVLLVTTEASIEEVCQRYFACGTGIPCAQICTGSISEDGRRKLDEYKEHFRTAHKLGVWYTISPKTEEIERQINDFKPDIVLWDYYQHFETGTEGRQIQLASLARWFESTALRYSIPIVVAAQLHERFNFKDRKRVASIKDDIKDCKVLNDAAKIVIVLDWDTKEKPDEEATLVRMDVQKNKGPMGETKILLRRSIPRFEEI